LTTVLSFMPSVYSLAYVRVNQSLGDTACEYYHTVGTLAQSEHLSQKRNVAIVSNLGA